MNGMGNYYFLAASLPPLILGEKPELSFVELCDRLEINLSKTDFAKTVVIRRYFDLLNIQSLFIEEAIDSRGNLSEKELDEALLIHNILPNYVFDFLDRYDTLTERIDHFTALIAQFFLEEIPLQKGFLKDYLSFERAWRLILLALRAKESKRDLVKELQYDDLYDSLVMQILAYRDAEQYDPPQEYREIKEIFISCGADPWLRNKTMAAYRFRKIEELVDRPLFHIDWILSYMAKVIVVESLAELDKERGQNVLETFKTG